MNPRKFLVSMGIALTALMPNTIAGKAAHVDPKSPESPKEPPTTRLRGENLKDFGDPVVERLTYRAGSDQHLLLLRRPGRGTIYADHSSHESHGSHASHSSGN